MRQGFHELIQPERAQAKLRCAGWRAHTTHSVDSPDASGTAPKNLVARRHACPTSAIMAMLVLLQLKMGKPARAPQMARAVAV